VCDKGVCAKPVYNFITGFGAMWGVTCIPTSDDPGCRCNYATNTFAYLIESSRTYLPDCPDKMKNFETCMTTKGCTNYVNLGYDSCLRRYCFPQYVAWKNCASDPSLNAPRCDASLMTFASLLMLTILAL
jgi:hypothetical protein